MKINQIELSLKYLFVALVLFFLAQLYVGLPQQAIGWDVFGYYLYLPFTFIYHDLTFSDVAPVQEIIDTYGNSNSLYQLVSAGNGNNIIKYPVGNAILMLPFFIIGHLIALFTDYPADGFSKPYEIMLVVSTWFYVVIGLWFLRKFLLELFSSKVVAFTIIAIVFGTNLLSMGLMGPGNAHNSLFALHAIGLFLVLKWHKKPTIKRSLMLGGVIGLMIITRPTEILFLVIPLFWGVSSFRTLFAKYKGLFKDHLVKLLVFSGTIITVGFIQLTYWKMITGNWLFYSYDNPGEGFDFTSPYLIDFLFSFRKGWLVYTPIMIFAIIGIFWATFKRKIFGFSLLVFLILNVWVLSSWSCWWYAGSYSQRSMVQLYPDLIIGFSVVLSEVFVFKKKWIRIVSIALISFLIILNVFQVWQYREGIIHTSRMTSEYYWSIFGKTSAPEGTADLLLVDRQYERAETFPVVDLSLYRYDNTLIAEEYFHLNKEEEYKAFKRIPYKEITSLDHALIKITGTGKMINQGDEEGYLITTSFVYDNKKYMYSSVSPVKMKQDPNDPTIVNIELWLLTPEVRTKNDELCIEIWNRAKSEFEITDFKVKSFVRK